MQQKKMPTLFISHGGGPWPFISEMKAQYSKTANWLSELPQSLPQIPKVILSISGHWEEEEFTISSAKNPPMIYDYSGFPEHTYKVKYPALGEPQVATKVQKLLSESNIVAHIDIHHGFDHGTFVPLFLMYPDAQIPVVSMSLKANFNPSEHILMGQSLQNLRSEGVLIIGSGLSYHNMRQFFSTSAGAVSQEFGKWLQTTVEEKNPSERNKKLIHWENAPASREAHPREDHLLPLMVASGAAGNDVGKTIFLDTVNGVQMASFGFGI